MNVDQVVRYDDALPQFAALVAEFLGKKAVKDNGLFLRDASGRITFVVISEVDDTDIRGLGAAAYAVLGKYVDGPEYAISTPEKLFDPGLSSRAGAKLVHVGNSKFSGEVWLVDRRAVGADWMQDPVTKSASPPRLIFSSLKGGVGRSTALCVVAASLASKGRRVLAVDMDLEAPGIGNMLLSPETLPEFGLLDYLVEMGISGLDFQHESCLIGPSWLGGGRGRVDVIPAIGLRSLQYPANVLSKISRAYLSDGVDESGATTFTSRVRKLLEKIAVPERYDVVLIDARAGLHETTASAMLGLGGEVLLFGSDQPQTIAGFELLLAHLGQLKEVWRWRDKFRVVHAKSRSSITDMNFESSVRDLFGRYLYGVSSDQPLPDLEEMANEFVFDWDYETQEASNALEDVLLLDSIEVVSIPHDDAYRWFDPVSNPGLLSQESYSGAFAEIMQLTQSIVDIALAEKVGR